MELLTQTSYNPSRAREWFDTCAEPLTGWRLCQRGDYLVWFAAMLQVERKQLVLAACECARLGLPYSTDSRPLQAVEKAEKWAKSDPWVKLDHVREAVVATVQAFTEADVVAARDAVEFMDNIEASSLAYPHSHAYAALAAHADASAAFTDDLTCTALVPLYAEAAANTAYSSVRNRVLKASAKAIRIYISEKTIAESWNAANATQSNLVVLEAPEAKQEDKWEPLMWF
jgi:hypothetical protein